MADNLPAQKRRISETVAEYDSKLLNMAEAFEAYNTAARALGSALTIGGAPGGHTLPAELSGYDARWASENLLRSAWRNLRTDLQIDDRCTAKDRAAFDAWADSPPPFTMDEIRAQFGDLIAEPRETMLRGVAEAFCDLDSAYKSHSKVKIGVEGLPKRIILSNAHGEFAYKAGQLWNVLDALAALNEAPRFEYFEKAPLLAAALRGDDPEAFGVTLRAFKNGNVHLIFAPSAQRAINLALAEYYGEALPDVEPETQKPRSRSTAVAKNLQFYPTPRNAGFEAVRFLELPNSGVVRILEPQCGDGRLIDHLRDYCHQHRPYLQCHVAGVEYHAERAMQAKAKGHSVQIANFLGIAPSRQFDFVLMNPPFYGLHYLNHLAHARQFLKPSGRLVSILPATAQYDHGRLPDGHWRDLPCGSFSESGTNVPTGLFCCGADL